MQQQTLTPLPSFNRLFLDLLSVIASVYIYIYITSKNKPKYQKKKRKRNVTMMNNFYNFIFYFNLFELLTPKCDRVVRGLLYVWFYNYCQFSAIIVATRLVSEETHPEQLYLPELWNPTRRCLKSFTHEVDIRLEPTWVVSL